MTSFYLKNWDKGACFVKNLQTSESIWLKPPFFHLKWNKPNNLRNTAISLVLHIRSGGRTIRNKQSNTRNGFLFQLCI